MHIQKLSGHSAHLAVVFAIAQLFCTFLVLPFWYQLTLVVPDKERLTKCSSNWLSLHQWQWACEKHNCTDVIFTMSPRRRV